MAHPDKRIVNTESLKRLNAFMDDLADGLRPDASSLTFFVHSRHNNDLKPSGSDDNKTGGISSAKEGSPHVFQKISANLPSNGNLGPLFHAFGLLQPGSEDSDLWDADIDDESFQPDESLIDLINWLRENVGGMNGAVEVHQQMDRENDALCYEIRKRFGLDLLYVSSILVN